MTKKRSASNVLPAQLGELELTALEALWQHGSMDAKTLLTRLPAQRGSALSTMQSTLERLYRKGMLQRHKQGHAFHYSASITRADLLGRYMGEVIQLLHDGRMETILSSFVTVAADLDASSLDRLEALAQARKQALADQREDESP